MGVNSTSRLEDFEPNCFYVESNFVLEVSLTYFAPSQLDATEVKSTTGAVFTRMCSHVRVFAVAIPSVVCLSVTLVPLR